MLASYRTTLLSERIVTRMFSDTDRTQSRIPSLPLT